MNLRELARGQPCHLRLDGCSHDYSETVLAHIRRGNVAGMGQKPPDICAAPACYSCHGKYDGRIMSRMTREELDSEMLRAINQWLAYLWNSDHIKCG